MADTLNETPNANRLHIGFFGKRNSGKSSLINAFVGHEVSIVSEVFGTTTDPVYKAMEINPIGACVIIDTAGFDDEGELGLSRVEKTKLAAEKSDIAVIVISSEEMTKELEWASFFKNKNTPVLFILNKSDCLENADIIVSQIEKQTRQTPLVTSVKANIGLEKIKPALIRLLPENYGKSEITGNLVKSGDVVMLVMPQDIQAPKGRLILPQVQTLRELLDKNCIIINVTAEKYIDALTALKQPPKLIITDSQIFRFVYENKPKDSLLTSFSVLFAAHKGDIDYYVKSVKAIDSLTESSKVLIAECCTHAPLAEDIGREKIPRMLKNKIGSGLTVDIVSGTDFPEDLSEYSLIIQCGGCMFNRKYIMSRIDKAKHKEIPMTNYGIVIAYLSGILENIARL